MRFVPFGPTFRVHWFRYSTKIYTSTKQFMVLHTHEQKLILGCVVIGALVVLTIDGQLSVGDCVAGILGVASSMGVLHVANGNGKNSEE